MLNEPWTAHHMSRLDSISSSEPRRVIWTMSEVDVIRCFLMSSGMSGTLAVVLTRHSSNARLSPDGRWRWRWIKVNPRGAWG